MPLRLISICLREIVRCCEGSATRVETERATTDHQAASHSFHPGKWQRVLFHRGFRFQAAEILLGFMACKASPTSMTKLRPSKWNSNTHIASLTLFNLD